MADPVSTTDILLGVVVFTPILIILIYTIRRMRRQREKLKLDIAGRSLPTDDRAYNQLAFARSEMTVLAREGYDVHVPESMVAESQGHLDRHDYSQSLRLSQGAHDKMVVLRQQGPGSSFQDDAKSGSANDPSGRSLRSSTRGSTPPGAPAVAAGAAGVAAEEAQLTRPPPNRTEAHFQINLLAGELQELRAKRPTDPRLAEGDRIFRSSQAAYQGGQYTEALRLGLRGRRAIGTQVQSLPPPTRNEPGVSSESATTQARCGQCGTPRQSGDQFCRKCGAPLRIGSCPRCGQPLSEGDRFCGVCGAPTGG